MDEKETAKQLADKIKAKQTVKTAVKKVLKTNKENKDG